MEPLSKSDNDSSDEERNTTSVWTDPENKDRIPIVDDSVGGHNNLQRIFFEKQNFLQIQVCVLREKGDFYRSEPHKYRPGERERERERERETKGEREWSLRGEVSFI